VSGCWRKNVSEEKPVDLGKNAYLSRFTVSWDIASIEIQLHRP
jgi:hypothetical protein